MLNKHLRSPTRTGLQLLTQFPLTIICSDIDSDVAAISLWTVAAATARLERCRWSWMATPIRTRHGGAAINDFSVFVVYGRSDRLASSGIVNRRVHQRSV